MIDLETKQGSDLSQLKPPRLAYVPTDLLQHSYALETNLHIQELLHKGIDIALFSRPAPGQNVSGDFIDIIMADERFSYIFMGDVAGHGEDAARISVDLHRLLRTWSFQGLLAHAQDLSEIMLYLDSKISKYFPEWGVGLTIIRLDNTELSATCASAGMYAPILLKAGKEPKQLASHGAILGWNVFGQQPSTTEKIALQRNDWLVLATDGILDLPTRHGNQVHDELRKSRTKIGSSKPKQLLNRMISIADASMVTDDQTIMIVSPQICPIGTSKGQN